MFSIFALLITLFWSAFFIQLLINFSFIPLVYFYAFFTNIIVAVLIVPFILLVGLLADSTLVAIISSLTILLILPMFLEVRVKLLYPLIENNVWYKFLDLNYHLFPKVTVMLQKIKEVIIYQQFTISSFKILNFLSVSIIALIVDLGIINKKNFHD
ncbi:hypothetical protein G3569_04630 [Aliifodinibius halophilus]|uniref:Uncharacterized protein n=2 Tax=Fodinibius halophilus TaxID=1736908 RepID=A0A6M1T110_9BACT|nr:hypothetical protein [Fodinibius halophilus]